MEIVSKFLFTVWTFCFITFFNQSAFAEQLFPHKTMLLASNNTFIFSPKTRVWKAINENGTVVKSGVGSGGMGYCPDIRRSCRTPVGTFHVMSKGGAGCKSTRYPVGRGGAKMPYCMFFTKLYAIHGSYELPNHNASHGCIRIRPSDASWLSRYFIRIGTKVIVKPY